MVDKYFPNRIFKAFLFDFDGTVADTMPLHLKAWNEALGVYGLTLSIEQHQQWAGRPTRQILAMLSQIHGRDLPYDEFAVAKESSYFKDISTIQGIVPVVDIVRASFGKLPMAVVSGSRRKPIQATMQHLGLAQYFSEIVSSEDYVNGKPAPDCFLIAATRLGVPPEDCLVFEDATLGIDAARAAGMSCLRVSMQDGGGHRIESAGD
jgi:beta-phosphoglucomutase-like phosphatase (HAD superfamily)